MSSYEPRDNSGSLFKNEKRETDKHPNVTGKAMIGGVMYYVSAWTKHKGNGEPWLSLAFKPVEEKQADTGGFSRRGSLKDGLDDLEF